MEPLDVFEHKGLTVEIFPDHDAESPREWDNLGTLVCFHREYDLGDKTEFKTLDDVMKHIEETESVWLPVFLMDHSGLALSTGSSGCPWDSGQVGVIFCTKQKALKEFNTKRMTPKLRDKILKGLKTEVETMHQYVSGEVYGIVIKDADGDEIDSCWGFFGSEYTKEESVRMADAALETVNAEHKERAEMAARDIETG